jgi:hypothetical protein
VALPWPRLRGVAFWALLAAVLLRTSEALADYGVETILRLVPLSGVLVWTAQACLGASFLGTVIRRRGPPYDEGHRGRTAGDVGWAGRRMGPWARHVHVDASTP